MLAAVKKLFFPLDNFYQTGFKIFLSLTIFLLPWQTRWIFYDQLINGQVWEYGRLSLYASMITLLLASVFFWLATGQNISFKLYRLNKQTSALILCFVYLLIISLLSPLPAVSIYYLVLIFLTFLFIYLLKKISLKIILSSLLASGLVQGLLAGWQFSQQKILANKWLGLAEHLPEIKGVAVVELTNTRLLRAYGALPHPNILGGFLVLTIMAGLGWWLIIYQQAYKDHWPKNKKYIWPLIIIVASLTIMTYGLLASFSRSALLTLLLFLLLGLIVSIVQKDRLKIKILLKYVLILFLVGWAFNNLSTNAWFSRWQANNRLENQSINQRLQSWQQIDFSNFPQLFFGQGLGMNTFVNNKNNLAPFEVQPIHNWFLLALAEVGIVGWLFIFYLGQIFYSGQKDKINYLWLVPWLVIAFVDHYLWTSWTGWLTLAIILSFFTLKKETF